MRNSRTLPYAQARRRWHPWRAMLLHARRRREYLPLWQARLRGDAASEAASEKLLSIEAALGLDAVLLFRALAQLPHACSPPPAEVALRRRRTQGCASALVGSLPS